jgi:subtilase family serine protease
VRNTGRAASGASSLRVALDGAPLPFAAVPALEPGEGVAVTVEGPACAQAAPVDADADAGEAVDERDEDDNRFTRLCPPS